MDAEWRGTEENDGGRLSSDSGKAEVSAEMKGRNHGGAAAVGSHSGDAHIQKRRLSTDYMIPTDVFHTFLLFIHDFAVPPKAPRVFLSGSSQYSFPFLIFNMWLSPGGVSVCFHAKLCVCVCAGHSSA